MQTNLLVHILHMEDVDGRRHFSGPFGLQRAEAPSGAWAMADVRRTTTHTLDAVLREIYGSLSDNLSFERSLAAVGGALHSHISALHAVDLDSGRARLETIVGIAPLEMAGLAEAYATQWAGQNLWIERGMPALLAKGYGTGEEVVSEGELIRTEYYQHFLNPLDIHFGLGITVFNEDCSRLSILSINRPKLAGPFAPEELRLVKQLRPHLVNAYAIYRRLVELQNAATSLREMFDHAPMGMLALEANGRVVDQNAEASRLLASDAGICCAPDRTLRLACPSTRNKFKNALSRLGGACSAPMPECLVIGKPGEVDGSLVLHLCAFPATVSQVMVRQGRILCFLRELGCHSESKLSHHILQSALNLTPMEATVVMSVREQNDPIRAAQHLGLAISTVRTHLKHVFCKTGTTRQSELLRLADRLLSAAPH